MTGQHASTSYVQGVISATPISTLPAPEVPLPTMNKIEMSTMDEESSIGDCTICLESLEEDEIWYLESCRHPFHKHCLHALMNSGAETICPLCRTPMVAADHCEIMWGFPYDEGTTTAAYVRMIYGDPAEVHYMGVLLYPEETEQDRYERIGGFVHGMAQRHQQRRMQIERDEANMESVRPAESSDLQSQDNFRNHAESATNNGLDNNSNANHTFTTTYSFEIIPYDEIDFEDNADDAQAYSEMDAVIADENNVSNEDDVDMSLEASRPKTEEEEEEQLQRAIALSMASMAFGEAPPQEYNYYPVGNNA